MLGDALVPGSCLVVSQASDQDKPADREEEIERVYGQEARAKLRSTGLSRVRPAHRPTSRKEHTTCTRTQIVSRRHPRNRRPTKS